MGFARADEHPTLMPIEIVEAEGGYFMGTEPQPGEQQKQGMIAQSFRGLSGRGYEDAVHLLCSQALGKRGMRPLARGGYGRFQARRQLPTPYKKPEKGADRNAGHLASRPVSRDGFLMDKRRNGLGLQGAPPLRSCVTTGAQEACDDAAIPRTCTGGGPANVLQVLGILLQPVLRSGVQGRLDSRWQEPLLLPEG